MVARLPSSVLFLATMTLAFVVSIALRGEATPDVSWLITMCERILRGERAYIDIFETTPPVPMLLYMPGVLAAKLTGMSPEAGTYAFAYASTAVSLWLSWRILPEYVVEGGQSRWLVLMPAAVVLLILPRDVFAQREYFAAAFSLPIVAVFIRQAQTNEWPEFWDRMGAAALGGMALAIKAPLFALPGVFVAAYTFWRTRSLSFLLPSGLLTAGVIGLLLTVASLAPFPDYLGEVSVVMREVYVSIRFPPSLILADKGWLGVMACLGLALTLSAREKPPVAVVLTSLAATGFLTAYFIQGKYVYYHVFPSAPFAAIAAAILVFRLVREYIRAPDASGALASVVYLVALACAVPLFFAGFDAQTPLMHDVSWAKALSHPRALAVTPMGRVSFPLARRIGAVWVGRTHSQWIAGLTSVALQVGGLSDEERRRYLDWHERDLKGILKEIREKSPEIIITDTSPNWSWLRRELSTMEPGFLDGYEPIAEEGVIQVLRRKGAVHAPKRSPPDASPSGGS